MPRPMNKTMLDIILAVQARKKLAIAEMSLYSDRHIDWIAETERYYLAIPEEVMERAGLKRNKFDFERIVHTFTVTKEMMDCLFENLHQFYFNRG